MDLFVIFVCLGHTVVSVSCSIMDTCWERHGLVAFMYVMFSGVRFLCLFTFPFGVLGQVWYLIVSIPDLCFLSYLI